MQQKHTRQCFVVLEEGADAANVEREIVNMPHYFADYKGASRKGGRSAGTARLETTAHFRAPTFFWGRDLTS
jgi:hypothetical protein